MDKSFCYHCCEFCLCSVHHLQWQSVFFMTIRNARVLCTVGEPLIYGSFKNYLKSLYFVEYCHYYIYCYCFLLHDLSSCYCVHIVCIFDVIELLPAICFPHSILWILCFCWCFIYFFMLVSPYFNLWPNDCLKCLFLSIRVNTTNQLFCNVCVCPPSDITVDSVTSILILWL